MNRESAEEIPEVVSLEESETQVSTESGDSQSPDLASQKDEEVPEGTSVITDTEISVSRAENLAMPEAVTVRNYDDDENFEIDRTGVKAPGSAPPSKNRKGGRSKKDISITDAVFEAPENTDKKLRALEMARHMVSCGNADFCIIPGCKGGKSCWNPYANRVCPRVKPIDLKMNDFHISAKISRCSARNDSAISCR